MSKELRDSCFTCFSALLPSGSAPFFDHVERMEEDSWRLDGIRTEVVVPQVIIPLYNDSSDESDFESDDWNDDSASECEF